MSVQSMGVYSLEQDKSQFISVTSPLEPAAVIYAGWGPYNTITTVTSIQELIDTFGEVQSVSYVGLVGLKKYFRYGSQIKLVRASASSDAVSSLTLYDASSGASLVLNSKYKGAVANTISITYVSGTLKVYLAGILKETFTGLSKASGSDKNANYKTAINGISNYIVVKADGTADADSTVPANVSTATLLTGGISALPGKADFIGTATGGPNSGPSGLQCFANDGIPASTLMCSDAASLGTASDVADVMKEIQSIAGTRMDLIGIVDVPAGKSRDNAVTFTDSTAAFNSTYVAAVWPWIQFYDSAVDANVYVPASLATLMVLAKNDRVAYPWYGAFGYNRGGVSEAINVEYATSIADRDILSGSQINVFVNESEFGVVLLGNFTKYATAQATQSLNVRRLMIFLKNSLGAIAKTLLAEPLDSVTRAQFKTMADKLLTEVQSKRGVTSFLVVCDDSNNPGSLVDQKIMAATIKLQPTRSTEIIQLTMQITSTGAKFDE